MEGKVMKKNTSIEGIVETVRCPVVEWVDEGDDGEWVDLVITHAGSVEGMRIGFNEESFKQFVNKVIEKSGWELDALSNLQAKHDALLELSERRRVLLAQMLMAMLGAEDNVLGVESVSLPIAADSPSDTALFAWAELVKFLKGRS